MSKVKHLVTKPEFDQCLRDAGQKLVVVDFTASWCGPCKSIAPAYEALASHKDNAHIIFAKVDVDENKDTASACGAKSEKADHHRQIKAMPTFHLYKGGKLVLEFSGADMEKLRSGIAQHGGDAWSGLSGGNLLAGPAAAAAPPPNPRAAAAAAAEARFAKMQQQQAGGGGA